MAERIFELAARWLEHQKDAAAAQRRRDTAQAEMDVALRHLGETANELNRCVGSNLPVRYVETGSGTIVVKRDQGVSLVEIERQPESR